jgi:hypothetical protein
MFQIKAMYNLVIHNEKAKVIGSKGKYPVHSNVMVNSKIIEQVARFNYL